jgi:hypothetical protein
LKNKVIVNKISDYTVKRGLSRVIWGHHIPHYAQDFLHALAMQGALYQVKEVNYSVK